MLRPAPRSAPHFLVRCSLLALTVSVPTGALADEAPDGSIIVTGAGLDEAPSDPAYAVTMLERDAVTSSASGRIEDVLSSVAGFQQFRRSDSRSSNPSAQGVTLRALGGNASSRALVLLDGVPMAHPFFGYIPLSAIDPTRIGAIRVTRGGGAGAFGTGAVAGTIELDSAGPQAIGLLEASALMNGRQESEISVVAAPRLGEGFVLASARWDRGKGFFTTPPDQREPASARAAFDSRSGSLRAVAPLGDTTELQFSGLVFGDERTLRFDGAESSSSGADASLRVVGRGDWQFDALAYVQARNFSNVVISSSRFTRVLDQRNTPSTGLGGKIELRPPVGEGRTVRVGTDLRITSGQLEEEAYSAFTGALRSSRRAGGRNSDLGIYAEADWAIGPVTLTAGARADRWTVRKGFFSEYEPDGTAIVSDTFPDRAGWDASFRGGAVWNASGALALRAAAYSGLRLPTLNELYRPFVVFPVETQANAALRNERIEGVEAGVDFAPAAGVTLSVTAFGNRLKNAIANVTLEQNLRQRQNLDAITARGVEVDAAAERGALSLRASLAYTDAKVRAVGAQSALDGLRPSHVPRIAASATIAWQPAERTRFALTLRHTGKEFEDDLETDVLPAATTLGAFAEMPLGQRFSIVVRGENLTDERIVTRNQSGSLDLGVPRTVWAGVKVRLGR